MKESDLQSVKRDALVKGLGLGRTTIMSDICGCEFWCIDMRSLQFVTMPYGRWLTVELAL